MGNNVIRKVSEHQSLLKVPSQYSSITTAIKFALAGDTVLVADGTYTENLNIDKDIKIIGENGAEKTIIDGGKIKHVTRIWKFNNSRLFIGRVYSNQWR